MYKVCTKDKYPYKEKLTEAKGWYITKFKLVNDINPYELWGPRQFATHYSYWCVLALVNTCQQFKICKSLEADVQFTNG